MCSNQDALFERELHFFFFLIFQIAVATKARVFAVADDDVACLCALRIIRIVADLACTLRAYAVQFDDRIAIRQEPGSFGKKCAFGCREQTGEVDVLIFSALDRKRGAVFYHKIFVDEHGVVFIETSATVKRGKRNRVDLFRFCEPAQAVFKRRMRKKTPRIAVGMDEDDFFMRVYIAFHLLKQ